LKAVLILTKFPLPLTSGYAIKTMRLINILNSRYSLEIHCIDRTEVNSELIQELRLHCDSLYIYKPSIYDKVVGFVRLFLKRLPLSVSLFWSEELFKSLKNRHEEDYLFFGSVGRSAVICYLMQVKAFIDFADSLYHSYLNFSRESSPLLKLVYKTESNLFYKFEQRFLVNSFGTFFNSSEIDHLPNNSHKVVPHGVNDSLFEISESVDYTFSDGIVFIGKMSYIPNILAVKWFVKHVLPMLPLEIKLYVVGSDPHPSIVSMGESSSNIVITGFVDNPYPAIRNCICTVAPVTVGAGIQNKVIESLALGLPTLVSPMASEIFVKQYQLPSALEICSTPEEWASRIRNHAKNKFARNIEAINFTKKNFSWRAYYAEMSSCMDTYEKKLND